MNSSVNGVQSLELQKKANNLRAYVPWHLAEYPEFSVAKSAVGRPAIAIRRGDSTPS